MTEIEDKLLKVITGSFALDHPVTCKDQISGDLRLTWWGWDGRAVIIHAEDVAEAALGNKDPEEIVDSICETYPELRAHRRRPLRVPDGRDLDAWFRHHPPSKDQKVRYGEIRAAGRSLAEVILATVPRGPDRDAAIRKVREAVMTANAGIACGEADSG